ncbi:Rieske 2Fe-2S domain-containing protein [Corynebacterium sp. TA-R-1]|uniref:Rieske 2Fe-2S domain-containing protein n=1 Tax=Corynebacterium stercoris TaxID=2943490 RepID=A0ABT1G349_9CORY|nr:Rieske 2Fe-2S domain-containing protein [Corynebacterium stercoris]MCP1388450.1 Rieske 2Fe-2S domain-containing protein [Corynebacterium stercoris]
MTCSRRLFLVGSATTFAGAFLAACGQAPNDEVAKTEVPVGSAVILDRVIIAQPTEGNFVAYSAQCPHQASKITVVKGDVVRCTKHGSEFSIVDGSVLQGPAVNPMMELKLVDEGDTVAAATS